MKKERWGFSYEHHLTASECAIRNDPSVLYYSHHFYFPTVTYTYCFLATIPTIALSMSDYGGSPKSYSQNNIAYYGREQLHKDIHTHGSLTTVVWFRNGLDGRTFLITDVWNPAHIKPIVTFK